LVPCFCGEGILQPAMMLPEVLSCRCGKNFRPRHISFGGINGVDVASLGRRGDASLLTTLHQITSLVPPSLGDTERASRHAARLRKRRPKISLPSGMTKSLVKTRSEKKRNTMDCPLWVRSGPPMQCRLLRRFGSRRASRLPPPVQHLAQIVPRIALRRGRDLLRRADGHHIAARVAALWA
jgi:hypothetical protein